MAANECNKETKLLKMKELCQEIIDCYGTVSDILKILINEYLSQPKVEQQIKEALGLFLRIDLEKEKRDYLFSLAIQTLEILDINKEDIAHKSSTMRTKANLPSDIYNVPKEEISGVSTCATDKSKEDNLLVALRLSARGNYLNSMLSNYPSLDEKDHDQGMVKSHLISYDVFKSISHSEDCKVQEKFGKDSFLPAMFTNLKIGNLSEPDKNRRLKDIDFSLSNMKDDMLHSPHRLEIENPVRVNFRLTDDMTHRESERYSSFNAVFRNTIRDYNGHGNCRPTGNFLPNKLITELNEAIHESGDVVVMPSDIESNQEQLNELVQFMKMSNRNIFNVQIQQSFGLKSIGDNESQELVVDVTINQQSRKPLKRRFRFRMHVVTSEMFENALRDCQIYSLELTYTNIFPSDCRMFIALPIYRDGYLDGKDRLDRN